MSLVYDENNVTDTSINKTEDFVVSNSHESNLMVLTNVLISKISELDKVELYEFMNIHSKLAIEVYKRSVELELLNEQEFMNWQDELNAVSFVHDSDL